MNSSLPARAVLMVRPTSFGYDDQTAQSNTFQIKSIASDEDIREKAVKEVQSVVDTLSANGIKVILFEDKATPPKPNAVFANNWLSMWSDGKVYLYPMATESRRIERNEDVISLLNKHFMVRDVIDLSVSERDGRFLESTGAMVFDHAHRIVYGCVSVRCDPDLLTQHAHDVGYTPIIVHAYDPKGVEIYHTNVLMSIQTESAVVCLDAVTDPEERQRLVQSLESTGHQIIDITYDQMNAFCGNVLELQNQSNERVLALSQTAWDSFTPDQRKALSRDKTLLPFAIPTIESIGGGSVRCMLCEIFLQQK